MTAMVAVLAASPFESQQSAPAPPEPQQRFCLKGTDGNLQINTVNADGGDNKVLVPHKAFEESPRWSPDGRRVAWVSTRSGTQEIYSADADGHDVKPLTRSLLEGARKEFPGRDLVATVFDPEGERIGRARLGRDGEVHWEQ